MKPIEKIKNVVSEFQLEDAFEKFLNDFEVIVIRGEVFAVKKNSELAKRWKDLLTKYYLKIIYLGKKLGRLGNEFFPNVGFFEALFDYVDESRKIELPYKKAWLFCCGRDVFMHQPGIYFLSYKGKLVGVAGYNKKKKIMKNLFDVGIYIRNQAKL